MTSAIRAALYLQIFNLLLKLQRRRRFIALSFGIPGDEVGEGLSYSDEAFLLSLEAEQDQSISQLADKLKLELSWVSRMAKDLENRSLIQLNRSSKDKRAKKLHLTQSGKNILEQLDKITSLVIKETLRPLSKSEYNKLYQFFKGFADTIKAPKYHQHPSADPLDTEYARVGRSTGILGDNFLDAGVNITQCQVLYSLYESENQHFFTSQLTHLFPFDTSTLTRTVQRFADEGLLKRTPSDIDRRGYKVELTQKGVNLKKRIDLAVVKNFNDGLKAQSEKTLKNIISILKKLTILGTRASRPA